MYIPGKGHYPPVSDSGNTSIRPDKKDAGRPTTYQFLLKK